MRKLASVRKIESINPIKGADSLELAIVDGWHVVTRKGDFEAGQKAIYFEIDSFFPIDNPDYDFLMKRGTQTNGNGYKGHRLKTIKLRGQVSQGLLLPLPTDRDYPVGEDLTDELGITKYEAPVPAQLSGKVKGNFPAFVPKTDEERVQNLTSEFSTYKDELFVVTEKLDGTSFTAYLNNGEFGVCSRNWDLESEENTNNTYWLIAKELKIEEKLRHLGKNIAIQGEIIGEGIQKNKYEIKGQELKVFSVFDIDTQEYLPTGSMLAVLSVLGLESVPVLNPELVFSFDIDSILEYAEGRSELADTEREGVVFRKREDSSVSFKVISNKFLLKERVNV